MTIALWITNIIVGLLVIADMLYGKHMAKAWMRQDYGYMDSEEEREIFMDYIELEAIDEDIEKRVSILEEKIDKPKRASRKKSTKKK